MKFNKIIFLLFFPLVAEIISSCCNCLSSDAQFFYKNSSISVTNLDNSNSAPVETSANTIVKTAYGIRVKIDAIKTACVEPRFHFINSAYATSCECPPDSSFSARDTIVSIKIFNMYDFDEKHLVQSDISSYFRVYEPFTFKDLAVFCKDPNPIFLNNEILSYSFDILLMQVPSKGKFHAFMIEILLSDGRILQQVTPTINLI